MSRLRRTISEFCSDLGTPPFDGRSEISGIEVVGRRMVHDLMADPGAWLSAHRTLGRLGESFQDWMRLKKGLYVSNDPVPSLKAGSGMNPYSSQIPTIFMNDPFVTQ